MTYWKRAGLTFGKSFSVRLYPSEPVVWADSLDAVRMMVGGCHYLFSTLRKRYLSLPV
jgi:hypothetical protein